MTDNKPKDHRIDIGEINTIRQILVGDRLEELERKLHSIQSEVKTLRSDMDSCTHELRSIIKANTKNTKMEILNKIVDLENRMVKHQEKTRTRSKKDKIEQTEKLSKLFLKLGREIGKK